MIKTRFTYNSISFLATLKQFLIIGFLLCIFAKPTVDIISVISDITYELSENSKNEKDDEKEDNKTETEFEKITATHSTHLTSTQLNQKKYFAIQKNSPLFKQEIHLPPPRA